MNRQHLLSSHIKHFFTDYLQDQRGLSKHTISSYRDTFKILIHFLSTKICSDFLNNFTVFDLNPKLVISFLNYLENKEYGRANKPQTRNTRLAVIHSFCQYLSLINTAYGRHTGRILSIPIKKTNAAVSPDYFERDELELLFNQINTSKKDGFRDYCILWLAYNTGARAQEISHLKISSLSVELNKQTIPSLSAHKRGNWVKLHRKGNKTAIIPVWESTAQILNIYINKHRRKPLPEFDDFLFVNQRGQSVSRFAIWKIIKKYLNKATQKNPQLKKKKLSVHSLRHTCATHMLQSGVELNLIKSWLSHENIRTTSKYLEVSLDRKREVLNKFVPLNNVNSFIDKDFKAKHKKEDFCRWLESL